MGYSEYKSTNENWLSAIPAHWEIIRLKNHFSFGKGLPITKEDLETQGIPVISYGQIHAKYNTGTKITTNLLRYVSSKFLSSHPQSLVSQGDFIFADTSEDRNGCGNAVYVDKSLTLFAGYHCIILHTRNSTNNKYLAYLFLTDSWRAQIRSKVDGVKLFSISKSLLNSVNIILPTPEEQDQIVRYLDWQVSKINKLIHGYQREIRLLEEACKTITATLLLRGTDPNASLKNSGSKWLGSIPSNWKSLRGKYLFHEVDTRSETGMEELLSVSHITGVTPRSQKNVTMFKSESLIGYKICEKGDIAGNTMWMWAGAIGVSEYRGVISPSYNMYRQNDNAYLPKYLDYLLRTQNLIDNYIVLSTGIRKSRLRLYPDKFLSIIFPVPPLDEQQSILDSIEQATKKYNIQIRNIQTEIDLLKEYRTRLISDVVTGQKDVRGIIIPDYEPEAGGSEDSSDDADFTEQDGEPDE